MPEKGSIWATSKGTGSGSRKLALHKESEVVEGKLKWIMFTWSALDSAKYRYGQVVGYVKGKSVDLGCPDKRRNRNFVGQHFWARGYYVSTVGLNEEVIREYVRSRKRLMRS